MELSTKPSPRVLGASAWVPAASAKVVRSTTSFRAMPQPMTVTAYGVHGRAARAHIYETSSRRSERRNSRLSSSAHEPRGPPGDIVNGSAGLALHLDSRLEDCYCQGIGYAT